MQRCIDNAIAVAKWLAQCAQADQFSKGNDGAAAQVRDHVSAQYKDTHHLGMGYFSCVFDIPEFFGNEVVIKSCLDPKEIGFLYLAHCQRNPGPHLPVVHYIERMFFGDQPIGYVVVLKKLRPLSESQKRAFYAELGADVRHSVTEPASSASGLHHQAWQVYQKFGRLSHWDLHAENVMMDDATKQIIITDPITSPAKDGTDAFGKPSALLTGMMRDLGFAEAA